MMTYPTSYPVVHPYSMVGPQLLNHRSHSIHVGAPDVNIDVHTTREHVARHSEKQVRKYLMCMLSFPVLYYYTKLPGHSITPIKNSIFRVILNSCSL